MPRGGTPWGGKGEAAKMVVIDDDSDDDDDDDLEVSGADTRVRVILVDSNLFADAYHRYVRMRAWV